eukprot:TRINITY_DN2260_c1_g1_i2.p1 TRINITY_DN2260_c1_g1~~TRINITY_DN2260_c1_g1_i2.p1  ORF type:complete len:544 (-),score=77.15 TRINITY_DN2260_c1_g1_i2:129-1760(-)
MPHIVVCTQAAPPPVMACGQAENFFRIADLTRLQVRDCRVRNLTYVGASCTVITVPHTNRLASSQSVYEIMVAQSLDPVIDGVALGVTYDDPEKLTAPPANWILLPSGVYNLVSLEHHTRIPRKGSVKEYASLSFSTVETPLFSQVTPSPVVIGFKYPSLESQEIQEYVKLDFLWLLGAVGGFVALFRIVHTISISIDRYHAGHYSGLQDPAFLIAQSRTPSRVSGRNSAFHTPVGKTSSNLNLTISHHTSRSSPALQGRRGTGSSQDDSVVRAGSHTEEGAWPSDAMTVDLCSDDVMSIPHGDDGDLTPCYSSNSPIHEDSSGTKETSQVPVVQRRQGMSPTGRRSRLTQPGQREGSPLAGADNRLGRGATQDSSAGSAASSDTGPVVVQPANHNRNSNRDRSSASSSSSGGGTGGPAWAPRPPSHSRVRFDLPSRSPQIARGTPGRPALSAQSLSLMQMENKNAVAGGDGVVARPPLNKQGAGSPASTSAASLPHESPRPRPEQSKSVPAIPQLLPRQEQQQPPPTGSTPGTPDSHTLLVQ